MRDYRLIQSEAGYRLARKEVAIINLSLDSRVEGEWTVVDVKGEIDLHTAPSFREHMNGLVDEGRSRIALDLTGLDFMDSTGLGVLVGSLKRLREKEGDIVLVSPQHPVRRVLSVTGLTKVFTIRDSLEEAVAE